MISGERARPGPGLDKFSGKRALTRVEPPATSDGFTPRHKHPGRVGATLSRFAHCTGADLSCPGWVAENRGGSAIARAVRVVPNSRVEAIAEVYYIEAKLVAPSDDQEGCPAAPRPQLQLKHVIDQR